MEIECYQIRLIRANGRVGALSDQDYTTTVGSVG